MRYYEFVNTLKEDLSENSLRSLKSIISFLKSRIDREDAEPKISSSLLITLMQNRGYESFNFNDLLIAYNKNPELQSLISKPEKNSMIDILPGDETDETGQDLAPPMPGQDQQIGMQPELGVPTGPELGQPELGQEQSDEEMPISSEPSGPIESPEGTLQTVKSMAKKALKRRQE